MALTEIILSVSPDARLPRGLQAEGFLAEADVIQQAIIDEIPDDLELDRMGRTELRFGPSGDKNRYTRGKDRSLCFIEDFDFKAWKQAPVEERDQLVFDALISRLEDIARAFRGDLNALSSAKKSLLRMAKKQGFRPASKD